MDERQLVALMLTDMVGYSRLSQVDEARALRLLEEHNQGIRDSVQAHGGRAIKGTGDGFLVEFPSALQAVSCAVDIQRRFHDRNRGVEETERFEVRIGLHLGDVVRRDGDVFGDGVNITARIEPLAGPGGISTSAALRDQVWNKIKQPFVSLGPQKLKNLEAPIEVFRVVLPWSEAGQAPAAKVDRTRLAVLPLGNVSPDPDDEYFADGMTEELIYTLSKVPGLKVIAQTSVMGYKGNAKPVREIARELSVGAVLEGSVRKAGERLRITVQLIDAASEEHLWAGRYDRELADVFEIQSEIAQNVAGELKGVLVAGATQRPTESLDAYKEYLKGRQFWARRTKTSLYKALEHFEAAVGADPGFAKAYSGLADTYTVMGNHGIESPSAVHPKARKAVEEALRLDPSLAEAHASLGILLLESDRNVAKAEEELRHAIELNPNYAQAYHWLGLVYDFGNRETEAKEAMERALELDPLAHITHIAYADMLLESEDAELAKAHLLRARDLEPDFPGVAAGLAWAEMVLWNWCGAEDALEIGLHRNPNNTAALGVKVHLSFVLGDRSAARATLEKAEGIDPDSPDIWTQRGLFEYQIGRTDEAVRWLERVVEAHPEDVFSAIRIANCYVLAGKFAEARRWMEKAESRPEAAFSKLRLILDTFWGVLAAREGRQEDVERSLAAVGAARSNPRRHCGAALILISAGRTEEAFAELEQAMAIHDPWLVELPAEPLVDPIRSHPRLQQMLEVMGLGCVVSTPR
ncbi:MAG: tetratricopeptide repeat protein [Candidatus Bipolaricaulota bacterium]|nr:tetratricopeptide repeat protein [Candidatus Bipolaricaulota bacterium]